MIDSVYSKNIHIISGQISIDDITLFMEKIQEISETFQITIQAFNADFICGKNHIYSAAVHAMRAEKQQSKTTHSLAMEFLLYAAGERQIKHALKKIGITQGKNNVVIVLFNIHKKTKNSVNQCIETLIDRFDIQIDDSLLTCSLQKIKNFGITETQLKTLTEKNYDYLILEKIAEVDIIK